jgi:hypothetical protein
VTPGAPLPLPLTLAKLPGSTPDVTLFTIGAGRARIDSGAELEPSSIGFSWKAARALSDYPEERRAALEVEQGAGWLVETTGQTPLYHWAVLSEQAGAIPPVSFEYFARATGAKSEACLAGVADAQILGASGAVVADPCPGGMLATVPGGPACNPSAAEGEIAASTLTCRGADDLAHALAGLRPDRARLTRQRGLLGERSLDVSVKLWDGPALSAVLVAPESDLTGCSSTGTGGSGTGSGSGWQGGGGSGWGASGGAPGYADPGYPYEDVYPDEGYEEADHVHTDVHVSCWTSSETGSSSDSCSGDSSSSAGDDSCSGDSSSSSSDDSCSGDSSTSGGESACSGDSSSSGSEGCSGDGAGSADAGCSGDAAGGGGDCSIRKRPRRTRTSLHLFALTAIAFALRRVSRRKLRV